jgi:agmatinase
MSLRNVLNGYIKPQRTFFGIPPPSEGSPDVGILGVPYDLTSSYLPGSRFGPDAIRRITDSERSHSYPLTIGEPNPKEMQTLSSQITIEDIGDLEVTLRLPEAAMYDILDAASKLAVCDTNLLFLGGDHFITYPLIKGLKKGKPTRYGLVYLDAHADLYEEYAGYTLSHASTLHRIVSDSVVAMDDIIAFDLRSALPDQRKRIIDGNGYIVDSLDAFSTAISKVSESVDIIYISIDVDVFHHTLASSTSHPESGGPSFEDIVRIVQMAFSTGKVKYADVVEYNPLADTSPTTAVVVRDIVKTLLAGFAVQKSQEKR